MASTIVFHALIVVIVTAALPIIYFVTTIFMVAFIGAEPPQVPTSQPAMPQKLPPQPQPPCPKA
jgi:hypothetical protein